MKRQRLFFGVFFRLCLLLLSLPSYGSFKVHFFDVGQGNCTLVYAGHDTIPLLVDAGSSSQQQPVFLGAHSYEKPRKVAEIAEYIQRYVKNKLNVVISHADIDHYNLILDILKALPKHIAVSAFVGGRAEDYAGALDSLKQKEFIAQTGRPSIDCGHDVVCQVLAAEQSPDRNRSSIVLFIKKGDESVILTGDATGYTTRQILSRPLPFAPSDITILQAAHHGADSEESNNIPWLQAVSPQFLVISAGTHAGYGHPRQKMLKQAFIAVPHLKRDTEYLHLMQSNSDWPFLDTLPHVNYWTLGRSDDGFVCGLTRVPIFSTATQGHVTYEGRQFAFERHLPLLSQPQSPATVIRGAVRYFLNLSAKDRVFELRFPPLQFEGWDQAEDVLKLTHGFTELVSCDVSRVQLRHLGRVDQVLNLLEPLLSRASLQQFDCPADGELQKAVRETWRKAHAHHSMTGLRFVEYDDSSV